MHPRSILSFLPFLLATLSGSLEVQRAGAASSLERLPREGFVSVTGGPVWYRTYGGGGQTPLLIIHGGPGGRSCTFEPLAEILSRERPVILYDQLGTGRSGRPTDRGLWTVDRAVRELGEVRAALGLGRVHLYGHSWGSGLAVAYMERAGFDGVDSVILGGIFVSTRIWIEDANILVAELPEATRSMLKKHENAGTTDSKEYQDAVEVFNRRFFNRRPNLTLPASCAESRRNDEIYRYMWGPNEFRSTGTLRDFDVTAVFARFRHSQPSPSLRYPVVRASVNW